MSPTPSETELDHGWPLHRVCDSGQAVVENRVPEGESPSSSSSFSHSHNGMICPPSLGDGECRARKGGSYLPLKLQKGRNFLFIATSQDRTLGRGGNCVSYKCVHSIPISVFLVRTVCWVWAGLHGKGKKEHIPHCF